MIIATIFAVGTAQIEVTQAVDGTMIEVNDQVLTLNPFKGSKSI